MPQFRITHFKTVTHFAEIFVEAKDKESVEYGDMGGNIRLSDWWDLDWKEESDDEPDWNAMEIVEVEEIVL